MRAVTSVVEASPDDVDAVLESVREPEVLTQALDVIRQAWLRAHVIYRIEQLRRMRWAAPASRNARTRLAAAARQREPKAGNDFTAEAAEDAEQTEQVGATA
jgi:hypothetical protein